MNNFVKQAYVQGLAARAILRARIMQKRAGGLKDYAIAGGVGAGGGALIGALIQYARKKNMLHGALTGAGIGGLTGISAQALRDLLRTKTQYDNVTAEDIAKLAPSSVGFRDVGGGKGDLKERKNDGKVEVDTSKIFPEQSTPFGLTGLQVDPSLGVLPGGYSIPGLPQAENPTGTVGIGGVIGDGSGWSGKKLIFPPDKERQAKPLK